MITMTLLILLLSRSRYKPILKDVAALHTAFRIGEPSSSPSAVSAPAALLGVDAQACN